METIALPPAAISPRALSALAADATLPICTTCGTQYPAPRDDCPCCLDPRQWVPEAGTAFTTLAALGATHTNAIVRDGGVAFILTEPVFGIGQTPILIETAAGAYIWDCAALLSPPLVAYLANVGVVGIAISHPHFFSTSLTWSRTLRIPLYLNSADRQWYARAGDVGADDKVVWWRDEVRLGEGVRVVECGGHFPGSSVLHWDRPATTAGAGGTGTGLLLTSDTVMVTLDRKGFTFMWSYPNMIPLSPPAVLGIQSALAPLHFDAATSAWPGKFIRSGAKAKLAASVTAYLGRIGWRVEGSRLVPVSQAEQEEGVASDK